METPTHEDDNDGSEMFFENPSMIMLQFESKLQGKIENGMVDSKLKSRNSAMGYKPKSSLIGWSLLKGF